MASMDSRKSSGSGLYSLNWNNYNSHLSKGIKALLTDDKLADVTLSCEGNCVRSHKLLLSLCSPYFKKLFEMQPHQKDSGTIVILSNVRFKDLKNIVKFIYTGEVKMQQADLKIFLQTCKMLKLNIMASDTPSTKSAAAGSSSSTVPPLAPKPKTSTSKPTPHNPKKEQNHSIPYNVDASALCQTQLEPETLDIGLDEDDDMDSVARYSMRQRDRQGNGIHGGQTVDEHHEDQDDDESGIRIDEIKTEQNYLYEIEDVEEEYGSVSPNVNEEADNSEVYSESVGLEDFELPTTSQMQYVGSAQMEYAQDTSYGEQYEDEEEYTEPLYQYQQSMVQSTSQSQSNSNLLKSTIHICDCGAKFYRKDSFRRHKKSHGAHQYNCPYCKKGFYRRDLYNRHLEAQHGERPNKGN